MVRLQMTREAIRALDEHATKHGVDRTDPVFQHVVNAYVEAASANMAARDRAESEVFTEFEAVAVSSQRKLILNLREHDKVDEELFQQLQHELDLADMHLKAITTQKK